MIRVDPEGKLWYGDRNLKHVAPTQRFVDCGLHDPFIGTIRDDCRFEFFLYTDSNLEFLTRSVPTQLPSYQSIR
jgi:hypothetical protein